SRLNNRRWCSMGDCGNRAKAKRHYLRTKQNPNAQSARANKAVRIKD
ncbi:MAG: CGNR zinc finger domain-containing protein, partial [Hyphomicrobiales bacterium]|nr:CGNR zinc finger domain-containing protein [Hyphomicrobiales bacterium]